MNNYLSLDYFIIYGFLLTILLIGLRSGRGVKDIKEYVIGNKNFSTRTLVIAFLATNIAGNSLIGVMSDIYENGAIITFSLLGLPFVFLIISFFIAPNAVYFNDCISMGDMMNKLYGRHSGIIAGILGFFTAICIAGMELLVLSKFCHSLLGIPPKFMIIFSGVFLAMYSAYGGIKSVTSTDIFQFATLFALFPFITSKIIGKVGSIKEIFMQVPAEKLLVFDHPNFSHYLTLFIIWSFLPVGAIDPAIIQHMLMGNNKRQLRNKFLFISIFDHFFQLTIMLMALGCIVIYPNIKGTDIMTKIIQDIMPVGFKGLVTAGVLGICMSTLDSYLHIAGVTIVHDVIRPILPSLDIEKNEVKWAQYGTLLISFIAIAIAVNSSNAFDLLLSSLSFTGPLLMIPLFSGMMGLKTHRIDFYISGVFTVISFFCTRFILPKNMQDFCIVVHVLVNGLVFFASHFIRNGQFAMEPRNLKYVILDKFKKLDASLDKLN
jgi:Na+/proline symporter